jgi:hypothetical protein
LLGITHFLSKDGINGTRLRIGASFTSH